MSRLRITFSGLCFFVPDRPNGRMHVLMPRTAQPHKHLARLILEESSTSGSFPPQWRCGRNLLCIPLEEHYLDISQLAGSPQLDLPIEIANLHPSVGRGIEPRLLTDRPGQGVVSRVTMHDGSTEVLDAQTPEYFRWLSPKSDVLTYLVRWTIPFTGPQIQLPLGGLNSPPTIQLPVLVTPGSAADGDIDVMIVHVTQDNVPPKPKPSPPPRCTPVEHFKLFYDLYSNPAHRSIPVYWGQSPLAGERLDDLFKEGLRLLASLFSRLAGPPENTSPARVPDLLQNRGDPYSCVLARGELA